MRDYIKKRQEEKLGQIDENRRPKELSISLQESQFGSKAIVYLIS